MSHSLLSRTEPPGPAHRPLVGKLFLLALITAVIASCSKGGGPITGPPQPPPASKTFHVPDSVQAIFDENCAYAGCHAGSRPEAGLNLSADSSFASLIDVPSLTCRPMHRVRPGKPDSSCIVDRLEGDVQPAMPLAGWIPPESRMIVVHWIAAGAPGVEVRTVASARHAGGWR